MGFEEMVKRIMPALKGISYKLNGRFSFLNHEDLYQEALVHLWQEYGKEKLQDKTDSYILQGCYFHLRNYLRKVKDKAPTIPLEALANSQDASPDLEEALSSVCHLQTDFFDYLNQLDNKLLVEKIKNNGLTKREKEVFLLFDEGLTTREIGIRLGISHVGVIKLKNKIRDKYSKFRHSLEYGY